jgi:F-type H+-transporting ATPase subunit delta
MADRTEAYAEAILDIARGEDALGVVDDELLQLAVALRDSEELHTALTDPQTPLSRRLEAIDDLLAKGHSATRAAVSLLASTGTLRHLDDIAHTVADRAAAERGREVGEVWVARPLTDPQRERLRERLEAVTGKRLELKVYVDESVVGGVRAKVGDTVIDGTLAKRLDALRGRVGG